ncbi:leucine-rich repeat-containing protein 40 isoform X1 [Planococcus citri]|uniref:leucine-rich repeat-containing protein 40 isoform X1 n=1 Tax=Planococcus citri TaxID=170843 RepID=UPI0031F7FA83
MRPPSEFGADITNQANNEATVPPAMMICTRLAGRAIIRVVGRCNDAQENCNLDLSECQLMQVPDAVYHLMRHTELKRCNLSSNSITKIPPKFAVNFSLISELNLSHNQMSKLPNELEDLSNLENLDISHNSFICLPHPVYKMPKLIHLNASHNFIVEVEVERLESSPSLEDVDLGNNPLTTPIRSALEKVSAIKVTFSLPDDWDDDL